MNQSDAGVDFLMFRPSEVAAAIALLVVGDKQAVDVEKNLSCCGNVAKVKMLTFLSLSLVFFFRVMISFFLLLVCCRKGSWNAMK